MFNHRSFDTFSLILILSICTYMVAYICWLPKCKFWMVSKYPTELSPNHIITHSDALVYTFSVWWPWPTLALLLFLLCISSYSTYLNHLINDERSNHTWRRSFRFIFMTSFNNDVGYTCVRPFSNLDLFI